MHIQAYNQDVCLYVTYLSTQTNEDEEKRKKRKRKDPSPSPSTSSVASTDSSRSAPPSKKKKKARGTATKSHPSPARSRTPLSDGPKLNRSASNESTEGLGCCEEVPEEEEEEEAECSAVKCLRPMVDEISWVQCDKCQEWFHCMCVRLTKEIAEKIDSYVCNGCKQVNSSGSSSATANTTAGGGGGGGGGGRGGASGSSIGLNMSALKRSLQLSGRDVNMVHVQSRLQT